MVPIMFDVMQYILFIQSIVFFIFLYWHAQKARVSVFYFGILLTVLLYNLLSSLSNLIRSSLGHHTALDVIGSQEYVVASIWWFCSITLFSVFYCIARAPNLRNAIATNAAATNNGTAVQEQRIKFVQKRIYFTILMLLLIAKLANPYSGVDFGTQTASTETELQVGGLLIDGILTYTYTAFALAFLTLSFFAGIPFFLIGVFFLIATGSKGMAAGYVVFAFFALRKRNSLPSQAVSKGRLVFYGAIATGLSLTALTLATRLRFGTDDVSVLSALMSSVGRFTQQDVAAVVFSLDLWLSGFRWEYISGTLYAFIPGFIFPDKPINPAYEINNVYGGGFTAASASIFGSLLIIFGYYLYWLALFGFAFLSAKIDKRITSSHRIPRTKEYSWIILQIYFNILEGNFVIVSYLMVIIFAWDTLLTYINRLHFGQSKVRLRTY